LAYTAGHDLNSPLRKIGTFGDLLKERLAGKADAIDLDYLDRMRRSATAAAEIVAGLLYLVRLEHEDLPPQRVELDAVLAAVKQEFATEIAAGASIEAAPLPAVDAPTGLPQKLLSCLISNAVKFARPGKPSVVRVEVHRTADALELKVADDGIGFEPAFAEKIFLPFDRLNPVGAYPGNGLGLAIARGIARRLGGELTAESEPGSGSTFTARLPPSILSR